MSQFSIQVKPEIIQERVNAAQTRDINKVSEQFKLNKDEINGDGLDIQEAGHLPYDTFMQISGNDTKITKADVLKFAGTETADDIIREYASQIANSLPGKIMESAPVAGSDESVSTLMVEVIKRGQDIIVRADRIPLNNEGKMPATEATASAVFSVIAGRDLNADGQISLGGGELAQSAFVATAGDAIKLAGEDMKVSPTEALNAIFDNVGKVPTKHLNVSYK